MDHNQPHYKLDKSVLNKYMQLDCPKNMIFLEYVWIYGAGVQLRSKRMEVDKEPTSLEDLPKWATCSFGTGKLQLK